jgi:Mlc titration factor MtfA (ptsG expression regulator)
MFFEFLSNRRRKKWLAMPIPAEWDAWLRLNVWQYAHLDEARQRRIREFVCVMFREKDWVGGNRLQVTDEMRVTIAGQAALMTLGFERRWYFDRLKTIIVYQGTYSATPQSKSDLILGGFNLPEEKFDTRLGESWQGGPIVLAWQAVIHEGRNPRSRRSVVIHEFAHHMDGLDGTTDGAPPMTDYKFEKQWYQVTSFEYNRLVQLAREGERTLLDKYGATNHAEFFAVSAECFFTQPHALASEHPELHLVLVRFFGQNPCEWLAGDQLVS